MTKSKETEIVVPSSGTSYYCAGRNCRVRDVCHRHSSSYSVNQAPFEDYDLAMVRDLPKPCKFYVNRNDATGVISKIGNPSKTKH
jgi:hypothetical protein